MSNARLPQEILAIIKNKKSAEEDQVRVEVIMKVFDDCIIPFVFNLRMRRWNTDPRLRQYGDNMVVAVNHGQVRYRSSFILTAIKRVCKSMKEAVSLGNHGDTYCIDAYSGNKAVEL
uniref:Uncharacterized protein n=1 Tax=Clandestinovirus TaxID=2831644 RepID=A0A8F8KL96_9VIRU|nr:hypothetical protein KOM_12_165 [Clandestinovirus]